MTLAEAAQTARNVPFEPSASWEVVAISPAPISDRDTQFAHAFFEAISGLGVSSYDVHIDAPFPQGVESITRELRNGADRELVIHIHAKSNGTGMSLETGRFESETVKYDDLIAAIARAQPRLVVLSGGNHASAAEQINRSTGVSTVYTVEKLGKKSLRRAINGVYRELFALGSPGLLGLDETGGVFGAVLSASGGRLSAASVGKLTYSEGFEKFRRRARGSRYRVHSSDLHKAVRALRRKNVVQLHGPKGSGVSTSLLILADYLQFNETDPRQQSVHIPLHQFSTLEQVRSHVCDQLGVEANSMFTLLTQHTIAFCVDVGGSETDEIYEDLMVELEIARSQLQSTLTLGVEKRRTVPDCEGVAISPLTREEKFDLLVGLIGRRKAELRSAGLAACRYPSEIYDLAALAEWERGVSHSQPGGIATLVREAASEDEFEFHPLLRAATVFGQHTPFSVFREVVEAHLETAGDEASYLTSGRLIHRAQASGLLSTSSAGESEARRYSVNSSKMYLSLSRGLPDVLGSIYEDELHSPDLPFVEAVARATRSWLRGNFPTIAADAGWLTAVSEWLERWARYRDLAEMADLLVNPRGDDTGVRSVPLRSTGGVTDIRNLLRRFELATKHEGRVELHERVRLFYAETCYKLDEVDLAIREFGALAADPESSSALKFRAHRALGQVALRSADYDEAEVQFANAQAYRDAANAEDSVTLACELVKLSLRRGDLAAAIVGLRSARAALSKLDSPRMACEVGLASAHVERFRGEFDSAKGLYRQIAVDRRASAIVRAAGAYWSAVVSDDRSTESEVMQELLSQYPGELLVGVYSSALDLLGDQSAEGGARNSGRESLAARLTRAKQGDLWLELKHATDIGPGYYPRGIVA